MKKTALMGFGNPCRSDDAVGLYVLEALQQRIDAADISFLDMGTGAFETLFKLQGHDRILLIDAVINSGQPAGTLFEVPAEEVLSAPQDDPLVFLHSIKWDQALSYAKKMLGEAYPDDITVYLIAVDDTALDMRLSEPVRQAGDRLIGILEEKLLETKVS